MAPQQFPVGQNAVEIEVRDIQPVVEIELRDVVVQAGGEAISVYEGAYEVTPRVNGPVVLPTKDKRMNDDVTVNAIPVSETDNEAGGVTLTIGA
nr:MAG TPA: hypothetical protein [Caudoviricetes sp.]